MNEMFSLKSARVNAGLSQKQMAEMLGVSIGTYQSYEHGKNLMRVDSAKKFSEIVKIPQNKINFFAN